LEDSGFAVIRFHHAADWEQLLDRYPSLFGLRSTATMSKAAAPSSPEPAFDPADFDEEWRGSLAKLAERDGIVVEPGEDVMSDGRVVDCDLASVHLGERVVRLVDGDSPLANELAAALKAQSFTVVVVRSQDPDLIQQVLKALES
jgi:hypothetical protein